MWILAFPSARIGPGLSVRKHVGQGAAAPSEQYAAHGSVENWASSTFPTVWQKRAGKRSGGT